jgi:hypothetical protein
VISGISFIQENVPVTFLSLVWDAGVGLWSVPLATPSSNSSIPCPLRAGRLSSYSVATHFLTHYSPFPVAVMQAFRTCASTALRTASRRQYATATSAYAATAENLRINKNTKLIYQGFTGKQGTYVTIPPRVQEFVLIPGLQISCSASN